MKRTLTFLLISLCLVSCNGGNLETNKPLLNLDSQSLENSSNNGAESSGPDLAGGFSLSVMDGPQDDSLVGSRDDSDVESDVNSVADSNADTHTDFQALREINWLYNTMQAEYLFSQEMQPVDPRDYTSATALFNDLIVKNKDQLSHLSAYTDLKAVPAANTSSFGLSLKYSPDGHTVVERVLIQSHAAHSGIQRGDQIIRMDETQLLGSRGFNWAVSKLLNANSDDRLELELLRDDQRHVLILNAASDNLASQSIDAKGYFEFPDRQRIGYLYLHDFKSSAKDELRSAFGFFIDQQVSSLIIDLRDNDAGDLSALAVLGGLLLPDVEPGNPFLTLRYNEHGFNNVDNTLAPSSYSLAQEPESSAFDAVHFITNERTCGVSEVFINSLQAYSEFSISGERTCGKPYGIVERQFENKSVLTFIRYSIANAKGFDGFMQGIEPTCNQSDERLFPLMDQRDPLVLSALNYLRGGGCLGF